MPASYVTEAMLTAILDALTRRIERIEDRVNVACDDLRRLQGRVEQMGDEETTDIEVQGFSYDPPDDFDEDESEY